MREMSEAEGEGTAEGEGAAERGGTAEGEGTTEGGAGNQQQLVSPLALPVNRRLMFGPLCGSEGPCIVHAP